MQFHLNDYLEMKFKYQILNDIEKLNLKFYKKIFFYKCSNHLHQLDRNLTKV